MQSLLHARWLSARQTLKGCAQFEIGTRVDEILFVVSRTIALNRVLKSFALSLNAELHFAAKLTIDFEVLNLELTIAIFLGIDKLWWHAKFELFSLVGHWILLGSVRYTLVQTSGWSTVLNLVLTIIVSSSQAVGV